MKEFVFLKVLDRFQGIFIKLGCDYVMMRRILQVKFTMDGRRVPTIMSRASRRRGQSGTDDRNVFLRSLWIYLIMGMMLVPFVLMKQNYMYQMSIAAGMLMFLVMTSMISDFSSVLLDIRDRMIISTKPVDKRTINFARTLHIINYLLILTGTLAGPSLIAGLFSQGIVFFIVYLLEIVLMDILVLVITALLYLLILNFFDGERLKDMINYFQIALSIAIVIGYQLEGHAFSLINFHVHFHQAWWQFLIPPFWFGATFAWLMSGQATFSLILLSAFALVIPLLLFAIYIRLMPVFERQLQKLSSHATKVVQKRYIWLKVLVGIATGKDQERSFFRFAALMMARERDFKLKVYPSLGFSIILPFIIILNSTLSNGLNVLAASKWFLSIYLSGIVIPTVMLMLKNSANYGGAWIYKVTPIQDYTALYKGTIKAALLRLFAPIYVVQSVIYVAIFGLRIIPDLVVVLLSMWLYAVITFRMSRQVLPFSEPFSAAQQATRWSTLPLIMLIMVFALVHYLSTLVTYGVYVYGVVLLILNLVVWKIGFRVVARTAKGEVV